MDLSKLEQRIIKIENRNKKVEINKAWEISWTRKLFIIITTYFIMFLFMSVIKTENAHINALVPTIGFFLSTLALPLIKNFWIKLQK